MAIKRAEYVGAMRNLLAKLVVAVRLGGKLNVLDLHIHSENFYLNFLNRLFGWKLVNLNMVQQNAPAVDLWFSDQKKIIQVSATCDKKKIESVLNNEELKKYAGYNFMFVGICEDASALRKKVYTNEHGVKFDPIVDIIDSASLLKKIEGLDIGAMKEMREYLEAELGGESRVERLTSNLAAIVSEIAKQDLLEEAVDINSKAFEIERKISFNNLELVRDVIKDHATYHNILDKTYTSFDKEGGNVSTSVLGTIKSDYLKLTTTKKDADLLFAVIDRVEERVRESKNFESIPIEELELCARIIVVDAFIRCRIFENPEKYALAR